MLVLSDVNETILDMSALDELFGSRGIRTAWFDLLIRTALVQTAIGTYRPFGDLAITSAHVVAPEIDPDCLRTAMTALPVHDDVTDGLTVLRGAGHRVVALGNSAREVIETQLTAAGIRGLFDAVHSADDVHALKPAPAAYLDAVHRGGTTVTSTVLVAAHDWDIAGARAAGLHTVLLDRELRPPLPGSTPDLVVGWIGALADALAALEP